MPLNDEGKAKGIAFIEFADAAAVEKALAFNGTEYGGRWIKVNKSNEKPSKDSAKGKGKDGKSKGKGKDGKDGKGKGNKEFEIFIGGLPWETTEEVLKKDFAECGEVVAFRMPLNDEGKARGIAFCEYTNQESVDKALKFDGTDYGGRTLSVRKSGDPAPAKGDKGKGKGKDGKGKGNSEFEVFVGGVPESATEDSLKKAFGECGEIDRLRLPLNEEGKPKGIAFIQFKDKDSCDKAVAMTDTDMDGSSLRVKMSGDGKGKGKDGKGKDGKGKGKGKGKKGGLSADKMAAKDGSMGVPEGKKTAFADSDDE
jgi:RNA recognition motif-containing protein